MSSGLMSIVVAPEDEQTALSILHEQGEEAYRIGTIQAGEERIVLC